MFSLPIYVSDSNKKHLSYFNCFASNYIWFRDTYYIVNIPVNFQPTIVWLNQLNHFYQCDYFLFTSMKTWLGGKRFSSNEEIIAATNEYFERFDKNYLLEGI